MLHSLKAPLARPGHVLADLFCPKLHEILRYEFVSTIADNADEVFAGGAASNRPGRGRTRSAAWGCHLVNRGDRAIRLASFPTHLKQ